MKKIIIGISATVVTMLAMGGSAAAVTCNGTITNSGPGSINAVNCVTNNNLAVACINNVVTANVNNQNAASGGAFTVGNTNAGSATSGSASNNNTVVVDVGVSCNPVVPAAAPNPTTPQGGQGGGAPVGGAGGAGGGQVVVPLGAVDAGAGGAAQSANVALPAVGLAGSLALVALGLRLRKPAEEL